MVLNDLRRRYLVSLIDAISLKSKVFFNERVIHKVFLVFVNLFGKTRGTFEEY